jgi:DNA-binding transcriptional ArsR family regulator
VSELRLLMDCQFAALELSELERRPVRIEVSPAPTLFGLAADVVGAHRGAPREWLGRVRAELDRRDLATLAPLGIRPGGFVPAAAVPRGGRNAAELSDELDRIAELPAEALLEDIEFACGRSPDGPWAMVARAPRRWLPRYADALRKAWRGVRRPWLDAADLFEREVRRVGVACARGMAAQLLTGIHPLARIDGGRWLLADPDLTELRLSEQGLTLLPILGGSDSARAGVRDDGTLEWIAYPLAGAWTQPARRGPAELAALIGDQRARLLRALDTPRSVGRLAETLMAVPSAATHHVGALETAGLVVRERDGRRVIVHRTLRGTRLVGLYDERC